MLVSGVGDGDEDWGCAAGGDEDGGGACSGDGDGPWSGGDNEEENDDDDGYEIKYGGTKPDESVHVTKNATRSVIRRTVS